MALSRKNSGLAISGDWQEVDGDGRVPLIAARPDVSWLAAFRNVYSVHGGLPKDGLFQKDFLGERLPLLVRALTSYRLVEELGVNPESLKLYAATNTPLPLVDDFWVAMELRGSSDVRPKSPLTARVMESVKKFREALCANNARCSTFSNARRVTMTAPSGADQDRLVLATYGGVIARPGTSDFEIAQSHAQVGLAQARLGRTSSAVGSLSTASKQLNEQLQEVSLSAKGKQDFLDLQNAVNRNLATSLRESGLCRDAKSILTELNLGTTKYRGDLSMKCLDRESGLYKELSLF